MRDTKGDSYDRPSAPDFTQACVVMFGVNLVWILLALWAVWGFLAVIAAGFTLKKVIDRIEAARR